MFRKIFYEDEPKNEKDYAISRRLYVAVDSSTMLINELAGGTFLVAVLNAVQISDGFSGVVRSCGTIATLFQLLLMICVQRMEKHRLFIFICSLQKIWFGILFFIPGMRWSLPVKCILICTIYLYAQITSQLATPATVNLIARLTSESIRGTYFGKKDSIGVFVTYTVVFVAGIVFDNAKSIDLNIGFRMIGATLIFLGTVNAATIIWIKEPAKTKKEIKESFAFIDEIKETFKHKGFQKILFINGVWTAAVYFTTPFNASYQIKELGLSYTFITAVGLVTMLCRVSLMPRMGRLADRIGNEQILIRLFSVMGIHFLIMMLTVPENGKLFCVIASLVSAIAWSFISQGLLGVQLKVLDERKRTIQYTILSATSGLIGFVISVIGGYILEILQRSIIMFGTRVVYAQQFMNALGLSCMLINVGYLVFENRKKYK